MKRLYYSQVPINAVPVNVKYHFTSPIPRLIRTWRSGPLLRNRKLIGLRDEKTCQLS
jgi:hypothetical protein